VTGPRRVELFGCAFDALGRDEAVEQVAAWVAGDALRQGVGVNVDHLVKMDRDPAFAAAVQGADLVLADGMPVVWASRALGRPLPERLPAIDLFDALLPRAAAEGWPVYLLGARTDAVAEAARRLATTHPGLRIVGARDGYFEGDGPWEDVAASGAKLLFLGMTSPKKELFVERNRDRLGEVRFVLGVGAAFDIAAGRIRRAPRWVGRAGLEWAYRLAQEPRRMARRYLWDDLRFLRLLVRELRRG
jgi:N-acetylglucosaminyldiphosphoundecaprenol N-acetyl-beta-D-mannosaminyltransferase